MNKLNEFSNYLLNNSTTLLTVFTGGVGFFIIVNSIRLIFKYNLLSKYKKYKEKIYSIEFLANNSKIKLYKKKKFLSLKNTGKDPCKMNEKIEIDDCYLSPNNSMYIDFTERTNKNE